MLTLGRDFCKVFANNFLKNLFISLFISFGSLVSLFYTSIFLMILWADFVFSNFKKKTDEFFPSSLYFSLFAILLLTLTSYLLYCHRFLQVLFLYLLYFSNILLLFKVFSLIVQDFNVKKTDFIFWYFPFCFVTKLSL